MKTVICALAKNENLYINDWVKWYIDLGFDQIYLYDNNDKETPFVGDFIDKEYRDKVTIINISGLSGRGFQKKIYKNFYESYKNTFDWCFYCDIDEFLMGIENIKTFLDNHSFDKFDQIRIKWRLFGDDNIIERDTKIPVYDFFKKEIKNNKKSNQGKALIRGNLQNIYFNSVHYGACDEKETILKSCLPSGKPCYSKVDIREDYSKENIYLNHYMTKTLSEFIVQKAGRGDAVHGTILDINYFWSINNQTPEKLAWLKKRGYTK